MKKLTATLIAAGLIAGVSAPMAQAAEVAGNVSITSNYIWRGFTQNGNALAVQGGLDSESGAMSYGIWGSSMSSGVEIDLYGAYKAGPVNIGLIYYYFSAGTGAYEINVGGDAGPVSYLVSYDPGAAAYYIEGGYSMELSKSTSLDLHAGYNGTTYDITAGVSSSMGGVDLGAMVAQHGTAGTAFAVSIGKSM